MFQYVYCYTVNSDDDSGQKKKVTDSCVHYML